MCFRRFCKTIDFDRSPRSTVKHPRQLASFFAASMPLLALKSIKPKLLSRFASWVRSALFPDRVGRCSLPATTLPAVKDRTADTFRAIVMSRTAIPGQRHRGRVPAKPDSWAPAAPRRRFGFDFCPDAADDGTSPHSLSCYAIHDWLCFSLSYSSWRWKREVQANHDPAARQDDPHVRHIEMSRRNPPNRRGGGIR